MAFLGNKGLLIGNAIPIAQTNREGDVIAIFEGAGDAATKLLVGRTYIRRICRKIKNPKNGPFLKSITREEYKELSKIFSNTAIAS